MINSEISLFGREERMKKSLKAMTKSKRSSSNTHIPHLVRYEIKMDAWIRM